MLLFSTYCRSSSGAGEVGRRSDGVCDEIRGILNGSERVNKDHGNYAPEDTRTDIANGGDGDGGPVEPQT